MLAISSRASFLTVSFEGQRPSIESRLVLSIASLGGIIAYLFLSGVSLLILASYLGR